METERPFQRLGAAKGVSGAVAAAGVVVPAMLAVRSVSEVTSRRFPPVFHRLVSRAFGVRTRVVGVPASGGVLYVANHISWMDIPMMAARLPVCSFVAKSEVGDMAVVGFLADLQRTIYVTRERRQEAAAQADSIAGRLRDGDNVILFPEGTSNDGVHLLPFKTTLFAVLDAPGCEDVRIQPLSIAYTRLNGMPMTRNRLIEVSWIGDLDLAPHAADVLRMGRLEAAVMCHAPVRRRDFADRKALARHCEREVARGYRELIRGHA